MIDELIAHGGWAIEDPRPRREANPETFWLPDVADVARLVPGTMARLIFEIADQADPVVDGLAPYDEQGRPNLVVMHERMWLWVEATDGELLTGILTNTPVATHSRLVPGARVRFRSTDVIDLILEPRADMADELDAMAELGRPLLDVDHVTAPEDPTRAPTIAPSQLEVCARFGVRPERPKPVPFVRALVGGGLADDVWPIFGGRSTPRPDRGDCGWCIWTGDPDMAVAQEVHGFEVLPVTDLPDRTLAVMPYLALPPGWAFVLDPDRVEDVYRDDDLLA